MPLALGIATAAGAPPISGLTSAIVAGLLTTFLRGSLPEVIGGLDPASTVIGALSLFNLILHPMIKNRVLHVVPAPLWVVVFAIPVAYLFEHHPQTLALRISQSLELESQQMVSSPSDPFSSHVYPSSSRIGESGFWSVVLTLSLVTSIENVVSVKAIDRLDPYRRLPRYSSTPAGNSPRPTSSRNAPRWRAAVE